MGMSVNKQDSTHHRERMPWVEDGRRLARAAGAVFLRDCLAETRQWHALNVIVMFGLISLTSVSIALHGVPLSSPAVASGRSNPASSSARAAAGQKL